MQWTGWTFKIFPYDQHSLRFILQDVACVAFSVESLWSCSVIPCSLPAWERHFWREAAKRKEEGSIHLYRFLVDGAMKESGRRGTLKMGEGVDGRRTGVDQLSKPRSYLNLTFYDLLQPIAHKSILHGHWNKEPPCIFKGNVACVGIQSFRSST